MKAKLTPAAAQAITNLRGNDNWKAIEKWLNDSAMEWNQVLVLTDDSDKRAVTAGAVRGILSIIGGIESAPQILQEMKKQNG